MQPEKIETKRLKLVGVEMYINLQDNSGYKHFSYKIHAMKADIMARLDEIKNKKFENMYIGYWQCMYTSTAGSFDRNYFCGVEVNEFKNVPYGMIFKDIPEGKYAIFNEKNGEEGTVTGKGGAYETWLPQSKYKFWCEVLGDFEVYNFDEKIKNHEVWIPIIEK